MSVFVRFVWIFIILFVSCEVVNASILMWNSSTLFSQSANEKIIEECLLFSVLCLIVFIELTQIAREKILCRVKSITFCPFLCSEEIACLGVIKFTVM